MCSSRMVKSGSRPRTIRPAKGCAGMWSTSACIMHAAPRVRVLVDGHQRHRVVDQPRHVLVDRGDEERLLVGEVGVRGGRGKPGVAADVGDRRASVALAGEAHDGRLEQGLAGAVALRR